MNKHYPSHAQHPHVLDAIHQLSTEQLQELYGIEIRPDGSVWDTLENREFKNLKEWAAYTAERDEPDNYSSFEKIGGRGRFDDD